MGLFILIHTPWRRFPKSSGPGEHKATAYLRELAPLAWLCKIQGHGSGEDSRQYGFDSESAGYFDMGSTPHPLGKWTMALNLLLNSGVKSLVHSQRVLTDPPLIGSSEDE